MIVHNTYAYTGGRPFDPSLPCVVFIHGAVNDHSVWGLQARAFAHHGYSVLALDLPGHGKSKGLPLASIEEAGAWLLRLLAAAGVKTAALVGHSMGSLIALEATAQSHLAAAQSTSAIDQSQSAAGEMQAQMATPVISHLVMVGTTYPMRVSPQLLELAERDPLEAVENVAAWSIYSLAPKPGTPGPGTWLYGASRALMRRIIGLADSSVNLFAHDFRLCNNYAHGLEAAQRITGAAADSPPQAAAAVRTSLVVGSRDQMTPARSVQTLSQALNATVYTLASGHSLMTEAPTELTAALRSAIRAA
nr:2-succinyl-6-hydroxy-2,4-cyclohexadiene-1-carboxylate synthase [Cupriavidus sp.]